LALALPPWTGGRRWSSPQRPGRLWTSSWRRRGNGGSTAGGGFKGSSILPAVPEGDLFLYNWWNPRPKDAQEASVLAFYRALGARAERRPPGGYGVPSVERVANLRYNMQLFYIFSNCFR